MPYNCRSTKEYTNKKNRCGIPFGNSHSDFTLSEIRNDRQSTINYHHQYADGWMSVH